MIKKIFVGSCALMMPLVSQAQRKSAWQSLPEDTLAAVRVDFSANISKQIQGNTRLGKQIFDAARIERIKSIIIKNIPQKDLADMRQEGFEPQDIIDLASSRFGFGVVHNKLQNEDAVLLLLWSDLEEAVMNKLYAKIEEKSGEKVKRVDIELDGQKVIHLTKPNDAEQVFITRINNRLVVAVQTLTRDMGKKKVSVDQLGDDKFIEEQSFDTRHHEAETTDGLVGSLQDEFVEGDEGDEGDEEEEEKLSEKEKLELAAISPALEENGKKYLSHFLAAQKGEGSGFIAKMSTKPGLAKARPQGKSIVEAYGDIESLFAFIPEKDRAKFSLTGLNGVKAAAMWMNLDGQSLSSTFFVSAPKERKVFLSLIDQPAFPSTPAAWVPASVASYSHVSFDFIRLYNVIKDFATSMMGPMVGQQEDQLNMQLQMFAGVSLRDLLSSFCKQISILGYSPLFPN
ncbi:MAG: hypothetical protein HRT88_23715, partial [Lentisphaeraceae bacterium]|nr:hypothetical protein [Lentisphaeraceae bacterium]